jgi:hypothetical protein
MDSLLPFLQGTCTPPTTCRFIPALSGMPVIRPEQGPSVFGANPAQNQEGPALEGALIALLCEHTEKRGQQKK